MSLLVRPLRMSRAFVAKSVLGALGLSLAAVFLFAAGASALRQGEWAGLGMMGWAAPLVGTFLLGRSLRRARRLAFDGEEVLGLLAQQTDLELRSEHGRQRVRRYCFVVDGVEVDHGASARVDRPLFVDHAHTRALCLRSRSRPSLVRVLRNDLHPFALSAEEERALRERIDQLRDLEKLVSDLHSC